MVRYVLACSAGALSLLAVITTLGVSVLHQQSSSGDAGERAPLILQGQMHAHMPVGRGIAAYVEDEATQGQPRQKRRRAHAHLRVQRWHVRGAPGASGLRLPERDEARGDEGPASLPDQAMAASNQNDSQLAQPAALSPSPASPQNQNRMGGASPAPTAEVAGGKQDSWKDQFVALCLAVRDQNLDLVEWIEHHASIGVTKFYIMDNNSSVPLEPLLADYMKSGLVQLEHMPAIQPPARPQITIYDMCLRKYGKRHEFMGFIDADEFIRVMDPSIPDLPSLLLRYRDYGGLGLNWQMYSSSGLQTRPKNGTLRSYTKCLPVQHRENLHIKSLVNTRYTLGPQGDPHHFKYAPGKFAVNTRFERVDGARTKTVATETAIINHYVLKSMEEYQAKIARGSAMRNKKTMAFWKFIEDASTHDCGTVEAVARN